MHVHVHTHIHTDTHTYKVHHRADNLLYIAEHLSDFPHLLI